MVDEVRRTDWVEVDPKKWHGDTAYRIWQRKTDHGVYQRHEWRHETGITWLEPWIPSNARDFAKTMKPAPK